MYEVYACAVIHPKTVRPVAGPFVSVDLKSEVDKCD